MVQHDVYREQPGDFAVVLTRLVQSEPTMRVGDTLFMRPLVAPVEARYLTVIARGACGSEFLTEYDRETFKRNGWTVAAYTADWLPQARTEILAWVNFDKQHGRSAEEQGAA